MIGAIVLGLLIPLALLKSVITERTQLRETAYTKVAQGWGGGLTIGGPMLVVPVERSVSVDGRIRRVRNELYLLPSQLDIDIQLKLDPEPRYVGIYKVPVYLSTIDIRGEFAAAAPKPLLDNEEATYLWEQSSLRLPLSQVRSLREVRLAQFAGQTLKLAPAAPGVYRGVDSAVDLTGMTNGQAASFHFQTVIAGSRDFNIMPVGSETEVTLQSDWPHPSFQGAFLPVERSISDDGFQARWQVLELNRSYPQAWLGSDMNEPMLEESAFGVGLYQAVDIYQRGERAIKYAVLFIALTFLTFFAWEQVSRLRIHPLQYLLIGLALSVFYLLLIALSEHIAFLWAYLVAAIALVTLIGVYVAGALRSRSRGTVAAGAMAAVYGLLYVLVLSEDYALLLGAITVFVGLAAVMLVTRKIDWYGEQQA